MTLDKHHFSVRVLTALAIDDCYRFYQDEHN
jgi:hypothetical protein